MIDGDARKKYPWHIWQNGQEHTISIFEFGADQSKAYNAIHLRASRTKTKASVRYNYDDTVTFRFFDRPEDYQRQAYKHTDRHAGTGQFTARPDDSHLPDAFRCAYPGCGQRIRPEWPNQLCHTKTDDPNAPNVWKSTTGALFIPKHEDTAQ